MIKLALTFVGILIIGVPIGYKIYKNFETEERVKSPHQDLYEDELDEEEDLEEGDELEDDDEIQEMLGEIE